MSNHNQCGESPEDRFEICARQRAILDGTGHMLVVGGPGSGKTTMALLKGRRAALERLRPEQSVLFLSFSNSAIRRIMESAGPILTREVSRRVEVKTYHSFAWDILRSHGYLLSTQRSLSIIGAHDAKVMKAGLEVSAWSEEEQRLFYDEGRVTFGQFAPRAADLLERSQAVCKCFCNAYPMILVDEFQDTDEDQWRMVRAMSEHSEIIALGDTEQRIYAWRGGVSETRLQDFSEALKAETFDFQNENKRSPTTGIARYARSLLDPRIRTPLPNDIIWKHFKPGWFEAGLRCAFIETCIETKKRTGRSEVSIAIATRTRLMVRVLSDCLAKTIKVPNCEFKPVPHDVLIDETQVVLAARVVALVLGSQGEPANNRLACTLEGISAAIRYTGKKTAIETSDRFQRWADNCRSENIPKTKCIKALTCVFELLDSKGFVGSPRQDWLETRSLLESSDVKEVKRIGKSARYLRLLRRGSAIEQRLTELWTSNGSYHGAEIELDKAIVQDQLIDNHSELTDTSVMTMHQLKGREFDGVLLVEDQYRTFRGKESDPPFMETRRLLQVSISRAKHLVFILSATKNATRSLILGD